MERILSSLVSQRLHKYLRFVTGSTLLKFQRFSLSLLSNQPSYFCSDVGQGSRPAFATSVLSFLIIAALSIFTLLSIFFQ